MIRLTIHHGTMQECAVIVPIATYYLRDHHEPTLNLNILEKRMWNLKLTELARIWFLLNCWHRARRRR